MNSTNIKVLSEEIQHLKADSGGDQAALDYLANSGNKNLLVYPYYETTQTSNGVTFTDNGDGTIGISGANNNSADSTFRFCIRTSGPTRVKPGTYILTGCPSGGGASSYYIRVAHTKNGSYSTIGDDIGSGFTFTITEEEYLQIAIIVHKGYEGTLPASISPMLRDASIQDSSWEPYSRSNSSLTAEMDTLLCKQTDADTYMLTATVDAQGAITYSWVSTT